MIHPSCIKIPPQAAASSPSDGVNIQNLEVYQEVTMEQVELDGACEMIMSAEHVQLVEKSMEDDVTEEQAQVKEDEVPKFTPRKRAS